ncbi:MAG: glycosyltransferase [Gammaproteobacteria bacterium]|nr:glycosyltransferase [Gammaproteobacteria bacterium]
MTQRALIAESVGGLGFRSVWGPVADVIIFIAATGQGMRLANAHLVSFAVATILNYFLIVRRAAAAAGRSTDWRLHVHLLVVSLFAVCLRGAVLGLLTNVWGWSEHVAIMLAAVAAMALALPGYTLAVRTTTWTLGGGEQRRRMAMYLVVIGFLLRLVYITQVELLPEDSYYWNYAQHLDLGYLDHPPMVAWLIWLGTAVCGDSEFGVRIGALCCAAVASFFAYRLTRNLFGKPSAVVALVLMQVLPFFFLAGMLMTPDAPLTAAWAGTLYFLERALIAGQPRAWLLAGVSIGIGLISKYTIAMLVPAVVLFVILDPQSRRWLLRWEPYAALIIALVIFSPVILWNAQHEWASFAFQTSRRLAEAPRFALHKLIISVLVLLTPTGVLTLLVSRFTRGIAASDEAEGADASRRWLFIRLSVLVPLSVFVVFSVRHDVKIDWTGALWLGAVPALATSIVWFGTKGARGIRAWVYSAWGPTAVFMLLLYSVGLHYLALGLPDVGYSSRLELVPVGWRDLGRQINAIADDIRRQTGMEPVIVGMDRYELASQLAFYAPDHARSVKETSSRNLFGQNGLMYGRWASSLAVGNRTLILVAWDPHDISDELTAPYVARLEPLKEGVLNRGGTEVRDFHYRIARGLAAQPLPQR